VIRVIVSIKLLMHINLLEIGLLLLEKNIDVQSVDVKYVLERNMNMYLEYVMVIQLFIKRVVIAYQFGLFFFCDEWCYGQIWELTYKKIGDAISGNLVSFPWCLTTILLFNLTPLAREKLLRILMNT